MNYDQLYPSVPKEKFNVLCLDGGGVHAVYQATLLIRIFSRYPELFDHIDLFVGTSAGGLLSIMLSTMGITALPLFQKAELIREIFCKPYMLKSIPCDGLLYSKYENSGLRSILERYVGETKLSQTRKGLIIPTFRLDKWTQENFSHFDADDVPTEDVSLVDLGLRTTAAPTYFPIYQNYCDGGVSANNPSLTALMTMRERGTDIQHIRMLSLGSALKPTAIDQQSSNWGAYNWLPHLVPMLMQTDMMHSTDVCSAILDQHYLRVQPPLDKAVALDDIGSVSYLVQKAEAFDLTEVFEWIEMNWLQ